MFTLSITRWLTAPPPSLEQFTLVVLWLFSFIYGGLWFLRCGGRGRGGGGRVCDAHVCDLTTVGVKQHGAGGMVPAPTATEPSALKTAATCSSVNVCSLARRIIHLYRNTVGYIRWSRETLNTAFLGINIHPVWFMYEIYNGRYTVNKWCVSQS